MAEEGNLGGHLMAAILHGKISLCENWNQIPSGTQYNTLATLLRSMTVSGLTVSVNTAGGLHLTVDSRSAGNDIANNPEIIINLVENEFFTQILAENHTFNEFLVNNQYFTQLLANNTYFVTQLAQNDTFVTELIDNNETFVNELTTNDRFIEWVRSMAGTGAGSFRLSYDAETQTVTLTGGQIAAGTHSVTVPTQTFTGGGRSFYAYVTYAAGTWSLGVSQTVPEGDAVWYEYIGAVAADGTITQAWTGEGSIRVTDRWVD